ncbi:MAG: hypothetical protein E7571_03380 [Ruminococcaceae bacterium]|nr:hypothetical protein [Oscillospiraceae bacterium]
MKKIVSAILCAILLTTTLLGSTFTVFAAESGNCGTNGGNVLWSLSDDGTLTISSGGTGEARMADFVNNGGSRPGWYNSRGNIKKIVIESGVVNIGAYAFDHCYNMTEIDFGSIDTIGNNALMNCTSLTNVSLPSSFNWMYSSVFEGCTALKSAYLGERWWTEGTVPDYFFKNCSALRVVRLGSKFTGFGTGTFDDCTSLKVIISDNSALTVDGAATVPTSILSGTCSDNTYSTDKLTYSYDMPSFTLSFSGSGDMNSTPWASYKDIIDKVTFAGTDAKTSISTSAFVEYSNLESVDFTNVYAIGWGAFGEDTKLGSLQFDDELTDIWDYAFSGCTAIDTIRFNEGSGDLHIRHHAFNNCTGTTYWIDLPANAKYIDEYAFWNTGFNYIKIFNPEAVIGTDAFGNGKGGYARFFSIAGVHTTTYDFVKSHKKAKRYDWHYYCLGDHNYATVTVDATCTEDGYNRYGCIYCDEGEYKSDYVDALGHNYVCTGTVDNNFLYSCPRCSATNLQLSAVEPMALFSESLTTFDSNTDFSQPTYDSRMDVNRDGFVNGRDWAIMTSNLAGVNTDGKETFIDTTATYQTVEGFGASGAWWAQEAGQWENAKDILRLLYSKNGGIGLNIYRYNLGAGSRDINDTTMYIDGERTNCFLQSDGTYNWNNDPGAMNALNWANKFCPNVKVELFCNSAPVYMTENGHAYCNALHEGETAPANLSADNYQKFATYVATCAEHFIDEGYNVTEVSPINEPEWGWNGWYNSDGSVSMNQEGCHFEPTEARDFYNNAMIPTLEANSKLNGKVELAVWECAQLNHSWWWNEFLNYVFSSKKSTNIFGQSQADDYQKYNSAIRRYVDTLDTHSYWASTDDRNTVKSQLASSNYFKTIQKIKCSEYCQMYNDYSSGVIGHIQAEGGSTNGMSIDYGLAMADIIYQDMTILNAVEWDWWTACGKGVYTDSLVYIDSNNHSNIQTSKRLWCLGNYSKFIQEGAKRIMVTTGSSFGANLHTDTENLYQWDDGNGNTGYDKNNYIEQSAYLNPDGTVAIVYINNSDTTEYTTFENSGYTNFKSYVTDATHNLELYQSGETADAVCIPARSCTTVVLKNVTPVKSQNGAYLFSYFTGNSTSQQRIHFAVSKDGYTFTPLNNNDEVITQTKGTLNCRDPYIFKGQDGYYYLIATDMDCNTGWWGNSNTMVIWRSADLVNWTNETVINMSEITGADDIQRCWAPQVIWDEKEQKYMVYFALASGSISQDHTVMYYCYTDDLLDQSKYSYPELLYKPELGDDKDNNAIDGDIIFDKKTGTYYLYYKDEDNGTICYVTSKNVNGPYSDAANPQKVLSSDVALEGCNAYFINGTDTLVMLADAYLNGYFVLNISNNFTDFATLDNSETTINATQPRHGSVISITDEEYNRLVSEYGLL